MNDPTDRLEAALDPILRDWLTQGGERSLLAAYDWGRDAMESGLGVLGTTSLLHRALKRCSDEIPGSAARLLEMAQPLFLECYSAFEMAHHGAAEANAALQRINETREQENRRLAYQLHSEAAQLLASVHLVLSGIQAEMSPAVRERLEVVHTRLREVEDQLRRISHELRPPILDDLGLPAALRFLAEGLTKRTGIVVTVEGSWDERLAEGAEIALYRTVQEALANVAKHARAKRVTIQMTRDVEGVALRVVDDGVGFDVGAGRLGLGLLGIRERVLPIGGSLDIQSKPGHGTELTILIPAREEEHVAYSAGG